MNKTANILAAIIEKAHDIDVIKVSNEVLDWVAENVVYFIDNKNRKFKLDLIIDDSMTEKFPETKKLQDLYHSIPEETTKVDMSNLNKEDDWTKNLSKEDNNMMALHANCREKLDIVTDLVFENMCGDKERVAKIYEKMAYFYEVKGINKGNFLVQELDGAVGIMRFEYESYSVPVEVTRKETIRNPDGSVSQGPDETLYKYVIPEGFSIWLEISLKPSNPSLF